MERVASLLLVVAMAAVVIILVTGVVAFMRGGVFNRRHANHLMNLRVAAQAVAVTALGLMLLAGALR